MSTGGSFEREQKKLFEAQKDAAKAQTDAARAAEAAHREASRTAGRNLEAARVTADVERERIARESAIETARLRLEQEKQNFALAKHRSERADILLRQIEALKQDPEASKLHKRILWVQWFSLTYPAAKWVVLGVLLVVLAVGIKIVKSISESVETSRQASVTKSMNWKPVFRISGDPRITSTAVVSDLRVTGTRELKFKIKNLLSLESISFQQVGFRVKTPAGDILGSFETSEVKDDYGSDDIYAGGKGAGIVKVDDDVWEKFRGAGKTVVELDRLVYSAGGSNVTIDKVE
ncbi:MAG: hypothetical protein JNM63_14765 [Spirochaetia bacterium]|nr:hypothetical protein [Spirochaetia bacterium]